MQTRFDASAFGEKLFSAARDGVERIGVATPVGGERERERGASPPSMGDEKSLEGNLKSIGKFFRRDVSGFGMGRFASSGGGAGVGGKDDGVR